jgi:hypothetical protein
MPACPLSTLRRHLTISRRMTRGHGCSLLITMQGTFTPYPLPAFTGAFDPTPALFLLRIVINYHKFGAIYYLCQYSPFLTVKLFWKYVGLDKVRNN